jgi:hypothetical protein
MILMEKFRRKNWDNKNSQLSNYPVQDFVMGLAANEINPTPPAGQEGTRCHCDERGDEAILSSRKA